MAVVWKLWIFRITAAAHIKSLGEMKREHGLTSSTFIQLYVNELASLTLDCLAHLDQHLHKSGN